MSSTGEKSGLTENTTLQVEEMATDEKIPTPEEIRRNVLSAMEESSSHEDLSIADKEIRSQEEVTSSTRDDSTSIEKLDTPTDEMVEVKNSEENSSEYENISMPKVRSLNDDDISTKDNTVAEDSDSEVFEIQLEDSNAVAALRDVSALADVEDEKKMSQAEGDNKSDKSLRTSDLEKKTSDALIESCQSQESILVLDQNSEDTVLTSVSIGRFARPKELDVLSTLEEKIDNIAAAVDRISARFKAHQEENAMWQESLQNLPVRIPDFSKLDWKIPSFTEVAEEAGQQAASAVVESAEALVTSMERSQRNGNGGDVITEALVNLVLSEPFREHLTSSIADSLKETLTACMTELVTSRYLPIFNEAHQEMTQQLNESIKRTFTELNKKISSHKIPVKSFKRKLNVSFSKDVRACNPADSPETPCTKNTGVDSNQIVEDISSSMKEILEKEFSEWRRNVVDSLSPAKHSTQETDTQTCGEFPPDQIPNSPPQPTHPSRPLMEQLMSVAEINALIKNGDLNTAFEKALSASDLALVMAACRATSPEVVFAQPVPLKQHVLLSLIQQLATDMVHETQLKCRYLEEALVHLDVEDQLTRKHLYPVAQQVKKNIIDFLNLYPGHMCGRKLRLIIMAAHSFLTQPSSDEA